MQLTPLLWREISVPDPYFLGAFIYCLFHPWLGQYYISFPTEIYIIVIVEEVLLFIVFCWLSLKEFWPGSDTKSVSVQIIF